MVFEKHTKAIWNYLDAKQQFSFFFDLLAFFSFLFW